MGERQGKYAHLVVPARWQVDHVPGKLDNGDRLHIWFVVRWTKRPRFHRALEVGVLAILIKNRRQPVENTLYVLMSSGVMISRHDTALP
jgi:hypothetical protein